jgi:hypothetical protein
MVFGLSSSKPQAARQRSSAIGKQLITASQEEKRTEDRADETRTSQTILHLR